MKLKRKYILLPMLLLALAMTLMSCGGTGNGSTTTSTTSATTTATTSTTPSATNSTTTATENETNSATTATMPSDTAGNSTTPATNSTSTSSMSNRDYGTYFGMTRDDFTAERGEGTAENGAEPYYDESFAGYSGRGVYGFTENDDKLDIITITFDDAEDAESVLAAIVETLGEADNATDMQGDNLYNGLWTMEDDVEYHLSKDGDKLVLVITKPTDDSNSTASTSKATSTK